MKRSTSDAIQTNAGEALKWFEHKKRDNGQEFWSIKDGAPDWIQPMAHAAHGDMMPDDWKYEFIVEMLRAIDGASDLEDITVAADIYTTELTRWLASHLDRVAYCDDAIDEFGEMKDTVTLLQHGQYREKQEVLGRLKEYLEERGDQSEAEE